MKKNRFHIYFPHSDFHAPRDVQLCSYPVYPYRRVAPSQCSRKAVLYTEDDETVGYCKQHYRMLGGEDE